MFARMFDRTCDGTFLTNSKMVLSKMGPRKMKNSPLVSKITNILPWSYPDAAAGPAAATSAAASAVCFTVQRLIKKTLI